MEDADMMEIIVAMFGVGLGLSMLGMGLLIAYYGSSKTRNVGFLFLLVAVVLFYLLYDDDLLGKYTVGVELHNSLLAFIGGMLGGILGIIAFLVAIIKS